MEADGWSDGRVVKLRTRIQEGPSSNPDRDSMAVIEFVNIYNVQVCHVL